MHKDNTKCRRYHHLYNFAENSSALYLLPGSWWHHEIEWRPRPPLRRPRCPAPPFLETTGSRRSAQTNREVSVICVVKKSLTVTIYKKGNVIDFFWCCLYVLWWPVLGIRKFLGLPDSDPFSEVPTYGSSHPQAKAVRNPFISTILWLLFDFLSVENDVNKCRYLQKVISKKTSQNFLFVCILKVTDEKSRIRIC